MPKRYQPYNSEAYPWVQGDEEEYNASQPPIQTRLLPAAATCVGCGSPRGEWAAADAEGSPVCIGCIQNMARMNSDNRYFYAPALEAQQSHEKAQDADAEEFEAQHPNGW